MSGQDTPMPIKPGADMSGWAAPALLSETVKSHRIKRTLALVVLLIVAAVDLIMFKTTLNLVLGEREFLSWMVAVGVTLAALASAVYAGQQVRTARASGVRGWAPLLFVAWALIGVALVYLRIKGGVLTPVGAAYEGTETTANSETGAADSLVAVVLAVLYTATGVLAFVEGYLFTNPAASAYRRVKKQFEEKSAEVTTGINRVVRLNENTTVHQHDLDNIEKQRLSARAAREALAAELKDHARVQIALNLGDPEATGVTQMRPAKPEGSS